MGTIFVGWTQWFELRLKSHARKRARFTTGFIGGRQFYLRIGNWFCAFRKRSTDCCDVCVQYSGTPHKTIWFWSPGCRDIFAAELLRTRRFMSKRRRVLFQRAVLRLNGNVDETVYRREYLVRRVQQKERNRTKVTERSSRSFEDPSIEPSAILVYISNKCVYTFLNKLLN